MGMFSRMADGLYYTLVFENRWRFYVTGIRNTLLMAAMACVLGIALGLVVALVKITYAGDDNPGFLKKFANWLANLYTTVVRGTPATVQLLIIYYVVFETAPLTMGLPIAALAFGINSGAYVSEIIRAGIQSIDRGQTEAGRSLGLDQKQTMRLIVLPQAVKNILPALFNEFITLLKETSIAGWISVVDVTFAGDLIRTRTWGKTPLLVSAAIYLVMVIGLTRLQERIERRLGASDHR